MNTNQIMCAVLAIAVAILHAQPATTTAQPPAPLESPLAPAAGQHQFAWQTAAPADAEIWIIHPAGIRAHVGTAADCIRNSVYETHCTLRGHADGLTLFVSVAPGMTWHTVYAWLQNRRVLSVLFARNPNITPRVLLPYVSQ